MKRSAWTRIAGSVIFVSATATAAVNPYRAVLNGAQLVPPAGIVATGEAALQFDDEKKTLTGTITYRGLSGAPTAADIHKGPCGANGAMAISLSDVGPTETVVDATLTEEQGNDLGAGNLYIAIRTAAHSDGELRGQLYYPRPPKFCPPAGADAGNDAGFMPREGFPNGAPSSTGPAPGGPWTGATNHPLDAGTSSTGAAPTEGSGCSTTRSTPSRWFAMTFGVLIAALRVRRARKLLQPSRSPIPFNRVRQRFAERVTRFPTEIGL